jgi:hypothetical protein
LGWKFAGFLVALILAVAILETIWRAVGWWLLWAPLILVGALVTSSSVRGLAQRKVEQAKAIKAKTAASEAALGIEVATDGRCPACHHPKVAGARYCTHCHYEFADATGAQALPLVLCRACGERQPTDATWCWSCGTSLAQQDKQSAETPKSTGTAHRRTHAGANA